MDTILSSYLDKTDRYLKPMPASERSDIIQEIKSEISELQMTENLSSEQIITRLGDPKELASAYLGDAISKGSGFSFGRFLTVIAFYSVVGFSGLFVIPVLGIIAPTFMVCGIICPLAGIFKAVVELLNLKIPFADHIGFVYGSSQAGPIMTFFLSLLTGIFLFAAGYGAWKLLVLYIKAVSRTHRKL